VQCCSRTLTLLPAKENLKFFKGLLLELLEQWLTLLPAKENLNFLMQEHNIQINTMQQPIVMNECMNRKNEEILRILMQETQKIELWIGCYGSGRVGG
jgi:hypothetical protein